MVKMRDNIDILVRRLGRLIEVLEDKELAEDDPAVYFSTGPSRVAVTNTSEFEDIQFGFRASTVNIRTTDDIVVSFGNRLNEGSHITIRGDESPFTIGGDASIDANTLWVKQAPSAGGTPGIEVVAFA